MPARTPEETHALLAAAFNSGDLDAFVDAYDEDAVLVVPPDGERASGRAEIRAALASTFALQPSARIEVLEKLQSDGIACRAGSATGAGASCSTTRSAGTRRGADP
jgi:ketosteroid isomerase-like protein